MAVVIKRVYDPPSRGDGTRVLVDRLWPRRLMSGSASSRPQANFSAGTTPNPISGQRSEKNI